MPNFPITPVRDVGAVGINKDTPSILLDDNIWSDGRNVRFDNGSVSKMKGEHILLDANVTDLNTLTWWPKLQAPAYLYGSASALYGWDGEGVTSYPFKDSDGTTITPKDYAQGWQTSLIGGGLGVLINNTVDEPFVTTTNQAGGLTSKEFHPLPGWPSGWTAGVIRANDSYLVAGNLTDNTGSKENPVYTYQPATIAISSGAAPGGLPDSWTITGGEQKLPYVDTFELSDASPIREIVGLRGKVMVFTDDSIHLITPANTRLGITASLLINKGKGVLATNCAIEFDGKVFAVDKNDIYTTDGTGNIESVSNSKMKEYFFTNLDKVHHHNTHVIRNLPEDELWICYPTKLLSDGSSNTNGLVNEAIIWNYLLNTWTIRDLANVRAATLGPTLNQNRPEGSTDFFELGEEKITMTSKIIGDTRNYNIILSGDTEDFYSFNDNPFVSYVERTKLDIGQINQHKWTGSVYPIMTGTDTMTISMKGQNNPGANVDLTDSATTSTATFDIQKDYKVDPNDQGRILNIRFSSYSTLPWTLAAYSLSTTDTFKR